jgi:hypothetical protein
MVVVAEQEGLNSKIRDASVLVGSHSHASFGLISSCLDSPEPKLPANPNRDAPRQLMRKVWIVALTPFDTSESLNGIKIDPSIDDLLRGASTDNLGSPCSGKNNTK